MKLLILVTGFVTRVCGRVGYVCRGKVRVREAKTRSLSTRPLPRPLILSLIRTLTLAGLIP